MSYFVRLHPEAEHDLNSAAAWYERQQYQLGQEFLDEFMKVRRTLSESPLIYAVVYRQTHRAVSIDFHLLSTTAPKAMRL